MGYYKNIDTGNCVLFHGSKDGIKGKISPCKNEGPTDFGNGFYLGTKELQTLSRVTNEKNPWEYHFQISDKYINEDNCLVLNADDWVFFVLYNRGKLEPLKGTQFYKYYAQLADGKDFVIGPIADDVYDMCITDFYQNNITDYTFKQLIDCFDYGTQIVAKSDRACDVLDKVFEKELTKEERKAIIQQRKMTKAERVNYYNIKKAELNAERKGKYYSEIIEDIIICESKGLRNKTIDTVQEADNMIKCTKENNEEFRNIQFPETIHERKDVEHGIF